MAIQLARAIGMQGGIPQSNLPQIIQDIGKTVASTIDKVSEAKQAKAIKEQGLKDAMASNISVMPIKASPQQQAEYERYVKENLPKLAVMQRSSNVTPAQYQDAVNNFKYGLKDREIKYGEDLATFEELNKRKEAGTHSVKEYEDFLIGTPDREEIIEPETTMQAPYKEKSMMDVEPESEENIAKPEKRITKGQQGYFSLPFEEQKKIDTKKVLEEKTTPVMPYMLDAAKGMLGKDYDFSYVITTDTSKGGKEFDVDVDKLEKDAVYAANMFANPPEIAPNKEFELLNRGIERQAITELLKTRSLANLEQNPELIAQTKYKIAYDKFKGDAAEKIYQDQLKLREEREKGKKGGMTFNFGQAEKQSKYNIGEPLDERLENLKTNKVENYVYYPLQGKAEGENKLMRVVSGYGNVAIDGVYRNKETNQIDWIKITVPAVMKTKKGNVKEEKEPAKTKYVKPTARQIADISAEVGDEYFYGKTEAAKPISETMPKQQATKPAAIKTVKTQEEFNKVWAGLKKGESIVAPDGKTYKKK